MANYKILEREVVDRWGEGEGRAEVQAVHETEADNYEVRVCYYQENGRFGQSAPTLSPEPDIISRTVEAIEEMGEEARHARQRARLSAIEDLIDDIGYDRAKEILMEEAADNEQ